MRRILLAIALILTVAPTVAQTVDLNLGSVTDNGGSNAWNNHMNFGGNESQLATGETEHYAPGNVTTGANGITLTASPNGTSGAITSGTETYGMPTPGGFSMTNGTLSITASMPAGANTWPALWLEPANPAALPAGTDCEIDIMEAPFNNPNQYQATSHISGTSSDPQILVPINNLAGVHTYGVTITPSVVTFLLDGKNVGSAPNSSACANQPMMLLANVAIGGWASDYANGQSSVPAAMTIKKISYTGNAATGGLMGSADPTPTVTTAAIAAPVATAAAVAASAPAGVGGDPGPDGGAVVDCLGNAWMVTASAGPGRGGSVMEGTKYIPGGGGTVALDVVGCDVYGKDDGHGPVNPGGWFLLSADGQSWAPSPTPPGEDAPEVAPTEASALVSVPAATVATVPVQQCAATAAGSSSFRVASGQIIGPNGPWVARGINLYGDSSGASAPGAITQTFTGLNFIRYIARPLNNPSTYDAFVNQMTSEGRVVEFEDHPDGGGAQDAAPPQGIQAESAWYAAMANHFKGNPYVWFGTFNEPMVTQQLSSWQRATYDAIRGAGNNTIIMIEVAGSRPSNLQQGLNPGVYASMTNVVWDVHVYPYQNNYSSDDGSITANINGMIAAAQTIQSADGTMPVIIGESGPSTTGSGLDANGYATVEGLITAATSGTMSGLAPFVWYAGFDTPNNLTDASGTPTQPYGQMAQLYINTDVVQPSQCQQTAAAQRMLSTIQSSARAQQSVTAQ